ncbi:MAG: DUF6538 domain-containing protein [Sideroxyarcus sp.]
MSRHSPYLQRRGHGLTFRISVPTELRSFVGAREITKALSTSNISQALPVALELAASAKRIFCELREAMSAPDEKKLKLVIQQAKLRIKLSDQDEELERREKEHRQELRRVQLDADRRIADEKLKAENEALRLALSGFHASATPSPTSASVSSPASPSRPSVPMFRTVVEGFLNKYQREKKPGMFKKHMAVLPMLIDVIGNKPITELKQADINDFFDLLGNLPPRWKDECRKRKLTVRKLAELDHPQTLGPKSFQDTYIASVRPFLTAARRDWQDQGFPLGLTTDGIEYTGDLEGGENKQRAFRQHELKTLFEGPTMNDYARDPAQAHQFWLPHIGLYTGARVNEICQLNPQTDIFQDVDTDVWCFWITKDTEADPRIIKSVKTGDSRQVPIHNKLIELGFLEYVRRVKSTGAKLLFPEWQPINKRASGEAEKWFRQLLRDTGLRDETPKNNLVGMHAFRHTLLTYGAMQETPPGSGNKTPLSLFCISGHAQDEAPIHATGAGKGYLTLSLLSNLKDKAYLLNQLDYGLNHAKPKHIS